MRRTARELKQFAREYQNLAAKNEAYLATVAEPQDRQEALRVLSVGNVCFDKLLLLGKLQWRHDLEDPRPALSRLAALAERLAGFVRGVPPEELARVPFPFPSAAFVVRLLEGQVPERLRKALPRGNALDQFFHDRVPDTLLLKALDTGRKPAGWDALVNEQLRAERDDLYADTYACLMDIVLSAAKGRAAEALELIQRADQLYPLREKDAPNFANSDGGGPFNDLMVDHRLAAVIQHCFGGQPEVLARLNTPHQWRWGAAGDRAVTR